MRLYNGDYHTDPQVVRLVITVFCELLLCYIASGP